MSYIVFSLFTAAEPVKTEKVSWPSLPLHEFGADVTLKVKQNDNTQTRKCTPAHQSVFRSRDTAFEVSIDIHH